MGSGRTINLQHGTKLIKRKAAKITTQFQLGVDDWVFFHLGEADCRIQLGRGYYPHTLQNIPSIVNKTLLDKCITNYINILRKIPVKNLGVISATTAYPPAFKAIQYFNHQLQARTTNFIDIFNRAFDGTDIKQNCKDADFKRDPLHLGSRVVDFFIEELAKRGIAKIANHSPTKPGYFNSLDIRTHFKVSRFGSYTV